MAQRLRHHYVDWGNANAPLLLLLHGSRDHCRSWDSTARALRADWHVIAPDLRGHGDSAWSPEGHYDIASFVYDLAQLVRQFDGQPITIVAHSLGAHIALRYAGLFPEMVRKLVAIEAVGAPRDIAAGWNNMPVATRWRRWIGDKQAAAGRLPKRYGHIDDAIKRMMAENPRLTPDQARHLTIHGTTRNEDGSWSWKFDNHLRLWPFMDLPRAEIRALWNRIGCPVLLLFGRESWPSEWPQEDLIGALRDVRTFEFDKSGHWPHHDQFDAFIAVLRIFLRTPPPLTGSI